MKLSITAITAFIVFVLVTLLLLWGPVVYNTVTGTTPAPAQYHLINGGAGGGGCC